MKNSLVGELSAEFLGTMILILFGVGVVAQVVTTPDGSLGDHDSITWAWGIGVTLGVYVAARLSGAHLNPAVTIALAAFKGFSWRKVLPYSLAQTAGAFVAALIVRFVYSDLINKVDPMHTVATQFVFSTLPGNGADGVGIGTAFFDQIVGTAILVFVIFALTTAANNPPMANLGPVVVGLLVVGIGMAWGANAGYAINPARDFGPRLASYITGYQTAWVDQNGTPYWWLPIIAPIIGGLIGGALFKFMIEGFLPAEAEEVTVSEPTVPEPRGTATDTNQNA
ncbi:aquaporin family protein [Pseudonocardia sp. KRD-184]|uniref:Aquaporin family protein n=1 Tax=Pseudonocardia oceani TaxID=2792013 RepID=A0ABS6UD68_9PSEU|nr:MIP/aquaporin family protein [Pseudonocardia oceani]MBW0093050.1 aquaporin family protein [Pseudonocardia oceani]MBW0099849.1 aquaporin family protein [Pseudonocardia oceani]MBW0112531.1 aquaporin family protein [Pseudonocardia oceani]MBW0124977.1 aquaporin family protein [Pseudonocardia oceani]MBW0130191.1 aquaporin family protein [Pseudonocardia oceani]